MFPHDRGDPPRRIALRPSPGSDRRVLRSQEMLFRDFLSERDGDRERDHEELPAYEDPQSEAQEGQGTGVNLEKAVQLALPARPARPPAAKRGPEGCRFEGPLSQGLHANS